VDDTSCKHSRGGGENVYYRGNHRIPHLEVDATFWSVFNMSATMAWPGGQVQLEQSDMRLVLNMAKLATGALSCTGIEIIQYLIKKPCTEVRMENM